MDEVLEQLGVRAREFTGFFPMAMDGRLQPADILLDAGNTSQLLTGLLFAYAFSVQKPTSIRVTGLKSKPYIDLTLSLLAEFGAVIENDAYQTFTVYPAATERRMVRTVTVEGDWSSAACLLVAGAIAGNASIGGLNPDSLQADKAILSALTMAGAHPIWQDGRINVRCTSLAAFEIDAVDCPDLFPVLAVLAGCCEGESRIAGIHRLFDKESNRVLSIAEMLEKFGVSFSAEEDQFVITGLKKLRDAFVDGFNDHRIVMAAAVGALATQVQVEISDAEAPAKSFPGFFNLMQRSGMHLDFIPQRDPQ
jgi:3-phosphoshikimate 1-carboxyvinyltransferase